MNHLKKGRIRNGSGFTLLEILFVLLIVGFLSVISLDQWDRLVDQHGRTALLGGIAELNARETFIWARVKVSEAGWPGDEQVFSEMDADLGKEFQWMDRRPSPIGGRLAFQNRFVEKLERLPSTAQSPGRWRIHEP